jgi:uncharacterized protein
MTKFIPLFPLGIVVYPTEHVNLHIFEPRYKQLIGECIQQQKPFAMATVINNELQEYGCLVTITEVIKTYNNGELDIRIQGQQVIRILELVNTVPDKLYSGAIVSFLENNTTMRNTNKLHKISMLVGQLLKQLQIDKLIEKPSITLLSYNYAHFIGLTLQQEYELQQILLEEDRQNFLLYHLQQNLNSQSALENLNDKVKLNGHFRLNK